MKKFLLTLLVISIVTSTTIFAKTAQVQLITDVDEIPVTYQLKYENTVINDNTTYPIDVAPLTENDSTSDFTITASSNMNSDLNVNVTITPTSFKTKLNGNTSYDSNITPSVTTISKLDKLTAGLHTNTLVNKFKLSWSGNTELPAGDYVSNVSIEYSID